MNARFSVRAERDLDGIGEYTADLWGAQQASRYVEALRVMAGVLALHPTMGVAARKGLRRFVVQQHTLFYRVDQGGVVIVRVLHVKQDVRRHL